MTNYEYIQGLLPDWKPNPDLSELENIRLAVDAAEDHFAAALKEYNDFWDITVAPMLEGSKYDLRTAETVLKLSEVKDFWRERWKKLLDLHNKNVPNS